MPVTAVGHAREDEISYTTGSCAHTGRLADGFLSERDLYSGDVRQPFLKMVNGLATRVVEAAAVLPPGEHPSRPITQGGQSLFLVNPTTCTMPIAVLQSMCVSLLQLARTPATAS